jgi:DNA-directed RNA polymerase subunit RPC12/RpoP
VGQFERRKMKKENAEVKTLIAGTKAHCPHCYKDFGVSVFKCPHCKETVVYEEEGNLNFCPMCGGKLFQ